MTEKLLYRTIEHFLRERIQTGQDGDVLPSQTELSRQFRVNHLTVRRALQGLEAEGLLYRIQGKGTFVRKTRLSEERLNLVVLVSSPVENYTIWGMMMRGMLEEIRERNIALSVQSFPTGLLPGTVQSLRPEECHGILCPFSSEEEMDVLARFSRREGRPVMVLNRTTDTPSVSYVSTDHRQGARDLTERLIEKGHRQVGIVGSADISYCFQRYEGFLQALDDHGLTLPEYGKAENGLPADSSPDLLPERIRRMLSAYRPTAVFASGIIYLHPLLQVVRERNLRVPEDLEIAAFDEIPEFVPEKPFVHEAVQPFSEMGKTAIREMDRIVRGESGRAAVLLPVKIDMK